MGPEAEKIFSQFGLADAEANDFQSRFSDYFEPKRNVIYERAKFHKRNQKEGESVEEYIRHLHDLSEHADFADRESTIHDRLVLSLPDISYFLCSVLCHDITFVEFSIVPQEHKCVVFHCATRAQVCSFPLCHKSTSV